MPDAYTYPSKPTSSVYSYSNFQGKESYDEPTITFDNSNIFYDGVNPLAYTNVAKPLSGTPGTWESNTNTWATETLTWGEYDYVYVNKPT